MEEKNKNFKTVLSFDVGIKNLSFCLMDIYNDDTFAIRQWDNVDLQRYSPQYLSAVAQIASYKCDYCDFRSKYVLRDTKKKFRMVHNGEQVSQVGVCARHFSQFVVRGKRAKQDKKCCFTSCDQEVHYNVNGTEHFVCKQHFDLKFAVDDTCTKIAKLRRKSAVRRSMGIEEVTTIIKQHLVQDILQPCAID